MTRAVRLLGRDPWLSAVLLASAVLATYQQSWGLPHGNYSWAADSLGPLTVLGITRRSLSSWNSGWFYFKYPLGYPMLLVGSYVPYLGWLFLTGAFQHPQATYPYGFADPEAAMYAMALLGRCVSTACVLGTVALTYGIGRRLFGRSAGLLAACLIATAYPVLYYAHTTNIDAAYLFWLTLALWATVVAREVDARWPYVVLGIAAAMAVSTKEQGFAWLLPLPLIIAFHRRRPLGGQLTASDRWSRVLWNPGTRAGLAATLVVVAFANNAVFNPSGFVNRLLYLSGRPIPGVSARLAPVEFSLFKGLAKEWLYVAQLFDGIESGLGLPLVVIALVGMVYVVWRHPRSAAVLLVPALAQYYLSLRTLDLITLRYTLPLLPVLAVCASAVCAAMLASRWRPLGGAVVAGLLMLAAARAIELDLLLRNDSRYQAEAWMRAAMSPENTVEIYQKPTYLPRLTGLSARPVPLEQRTIEGIRERRPEYVVISSAARKGITHRWNPDWRQGNQLLVPGPGAPEFLQALEGDRLPYRPIARFSQRPRLLRLRITSLCPRISIYRRTEP